MTSPSITLTNNTATTGECNVAWNDAAEDANWYSYRVYIREVGMNDWNLLKEFTNDITNYSYDAYAFASGVSNEVVVVEVTQAVTGGELTEGTYANSDTFTASTTEGYFLVDAENNSNSFYLEHVKGDSWDDVYEQGSFLLLGRGRKVDFGTHTGRSGDLTATIFPTSTRTVRSQIQELASLRSTGSRVIFIRNPFGDLIKTSISSISHQRIPAGFDDRMDVTISWLEVA